MKKLPYIVALVLIGGLMIVHAAGLYPSSGEQRGPTLTTCTNNSKLLAGTDLGKETVAIHLYFDIAANKTADVALASGVTFGKGLTKVINGSSITFPSTTYPFVPGGGVYLIGEEAGTLCTGRVVTLLP